MLNAWRTSLPLLLLLLTGPFMRSQDFDSACVRQKHVLSLLGKLHYSPPQHDIATRQEVLDLFVRAADEKNIFFMRSDVEALEEICEKVSPPGIYCSLIEFSYFIIRGRMVQLDSIIAGIEKMELVLDGSDTLNFVFRKKDRLYFNSIDELQHRIEKRIKYKALTYITRTATLNNLQNEQVDIRPDSFLLDKAKKMALHAFERSFSQIRDAGALVRHLSDCMSNSLAQRCDPHSNYLSAASFERYRNALSTHESSFGFTVGESKTGELVLQELVPGGPAWKSNELNEEDIVAAISFKGEETMPVGELTADEINEQLAKSEAEEVNLMVIKKDLQIRSVTLLREKIRSAGNTLNSYVVSRGGKRIGFIPIPSFYLHDDGENNQGCANDVAKEIIELRKDSVQGIILDLRYNGGGSMREAIGLAGIFINEGPVAVYSHRGETPFLLKDQNRGSIWDGPLLLLINSASASAAEFVTATLQDYNRAVVAGSESFGKGTAQSFIPADSNALSEGFIPDPRAGFLKITGGKFYRVTTLSHQGKGIVPDIPIPGVIEKVLQKEAAYPFFLPCDSVEKNVDYEAFPPLPLAELRARSRGRLDKTPAFNSIEQLGDSLRSVSQITEKVPLSIADFLEFSAKQKRLQRKMEAIFTVRKSSLVIRNNSDNEKVIAMDPYLQRSSEKTLEQLQKDITFHEGVNIMNDLIDLSR